MRLSLALQSFPVEAIVQGGQARVWMERTGESELSLYRRLAER
jgi:hypothetical protein